MSCRSIWCFQVVPATSEYLENWYCLGHMCIIFSTKIPDISVELWKYPVCFLNRALLHASVLNLLVPSFITGRTQSYHTFLFLICTVPHSYQGEPYHRSDLSSVDPSPEKSSLFVALRLECFLTSHVRVRKRFLRPITDPEHPRCVARKNVSILGHSYDLKTVLQASLLWDTHYPVSGYQDAYHGYLLLPIPHVLCF